MKKIIKKLLHFFIRNNPPTVDENIAKVIKELRAQGATIGDNCIFNRSVVVADPLLLTVGDNVIVTGWVKLLTHDGSPMIFREEIGEKYIYGPITIGDNVFIGMASIIMPGITIGNNVIIGAGSVVRKDIPDNVVVMGNPAKVVFKMSFAEKLMMNHKNLLQRKEVIPDLEYAKMLEKHFAIPISQKDLFYLKNDLQRD